MEIDFLPHLRHSLPTHQNTQSSPEDHETPPKGSSLKSFRCSIVNDKFDSGCLLTALLIYYIVEARQITINIFKKILYKQYRDWFDNIKCIFYEMDSWTIPRKSI